MPLRPRELIDSLTRSEIEDIIKKFLRREVRRINTSATVADTGKRFDAYDSMGQQLVTDMPVTLNLDTVEINTDATVFSLVGDQLTVSQSGVLDVTISVTVGSLVSGEYGFEWVLRRNGTEIARTRTKGGAGVIS